jgi:hypothetical protein
VPLSPLRKLKVALDCLLHDDIIAKQAEPIACVNSLLIGDTNNGQVHLVLDPKDLDKAIKR